MTIENVGAGYEFIPGPPFASNGVIASPGTTIERGVFAEPILLAEGFEEVRRHLERAGRPWRPCVGSICGYPTPERWRSSWPSTVSISRSWMLGSF